jgi:GDPmannose 4,6-dehydratase
LDYRDYVQEDASDYRPIEPTLLVGSAAKAKSELSWKPEIEFRELVHMMVDADLRSLSEEI